MLDRDAADTAMITAPDGETLERIIAARETPSGTELDDRAFRRWQHARMRTTWGRAHIQPVALVSSNRLLASAMRYHLEGVLDGRAVRVCGVGSVRSHVEGATDGATCALVDQVLDQAATDGAEMGLIFSPLNDSWRRRRGATEVTPRTVTLTLSPLKRPGTPMMPTRAGEERDLPSIAAMGEVRAAPFRFHLRRDVDFIQQAIVSRRLLAGLHPQGVQELNFAVAEEGGNAAAYVVLTAASGRWTLHECGDRDPTGARVGAILQALVARDPTAAPSGIHGSFPAGFLPPQVTVAPAPSEAVVLACRLGARAGEGSPLDAADVLYWLGDIA